MSNLTTPESVQKLQTALHDKAKEAPNFRFYALYDKVYRKDVLTFAYECCKANGGAAGVDGQTFENIEAYGKERWLDELAQELKSRTYQPLPVRRVYIPKPDGKRRPLGVPAVRDRAAQMAAVLVLEPIFEADLQSEQYAYRKDRSALDAVRHVHKLINTGHGEIVDADLSSYFDTVPHAELLKSVARRIVDGNMLHLIKMWLEAPVEETDEGAPFRRSMMLALITYSKRAPFYNAFSTTDFHPVTSNSSRRALSIRSIQRDEMENSDKRPILRSNEQLYAELQWLEWAKELSAETLTEITNTAEYVEFHAGEVVIEVESEVTHVYFLLTGRLQARLYDLLGKEVQKGTFIRGAVIGLFSLGSSERSHLHVEATEFSTTIRLTLSDLLRLTTKHADFQLTMFRLAANIVKRYLTVDRSRPKPSVVGIVHHTEASRPLVARLAHRLLDLGESPCILGDDEQWKPDGEIPFRLVVGDGRVEERPAILKDWAAHRRLLVDVRADHSREAMERFLSYVDIVLWCVRPQDARAAVHALQGLEKNVQNWRDKLRIVWLLGSNTPIPPYVPELRELAERDFKLSFDAPAANQSSLLQHGLERIVHHLRGVQIGLALGGGAARGMAHLGVFRALDQHGIYIDMLAGTSAGAMTGALYAAGLDPDYLIHVFTTELQLPWFFQRLPAGGYWYLLYKYRRHEFDSMLRKHLGGAKMEQLLIPVFTIAVDLVEGGPLVRSAGDATMDVLESINLPPLALPIFQSGQAFVDGGLLNNIPADVLVAKGCNFVIASTVTAKLEKDFGRPHSKRRSRGAPSVSSIQVMMRQSMIQSHSMNAVGVQPADFVIAPDVTSFDLSEFTRADEMALVGEATTNATIGDLRKMLNKLDPRLFESS